MKRLAALRDFLTCCMALSLAGVIQVVHQLGGSLVLHPNFVSIVLVTLALYAIISLVRHLAEINR